MGDSICSDMDVEVDQAARSSSVRRLRVNLVQAFKEQEQELRERLVSKIRSASIRANNDGDVWLGAWLGEVFCYLRYSVREDKFLVLRYLVNENGDAENMNAWTNSKTKIMEVNLVSE